MPRTAANGIDLEYESIGPADAPVALLIAGWGAQLITWPDGFCAGLVARGFRVVRFDNRDVGLSSKIDDGSAYTLTDMAEDAVGLLDALDIDVAHVMGNSMGGMIAQIVAIDHPERVLSLTSVYSTTGARDVGGAHPSLAGVLTAVRGDTREERIASGVMTSRAIWGDTPQYPFDEEHAIWRSSVSHDRNWCPEGRIRQLMAIRDTPDRTDALRNLDVPTLVIHGDNDPLIDVSGGHATAVAIPGAELLILEGMGHVLHQLSWPLVLDAFERLVARAPSALRR